MQVCSHADMNLAPSEVNSYIRFAQNKKLSLFQQHHSPTLHLHHKGLFNRDPPAVDDLALVVRQVPAVCVLKLDGVKHGLSGETQKHPLSLRAQGFTRYNII